ncbi:metallophosphoesterase family protein [Halopiger aswanensis]|uniref:3',5'-cyclic AMP phosphodiesterase CpdA n=1 Tax=Halopiger aswanensis TaxID=148449 RepID=A0A419WQ42_9EURY|nr:metallophosphoesterase [Halopiger aswanensis]RKD97582.1 3',5'-cyclic AMP phosphodiesterase CpdA [Halopiger aswanensis]
MTGDEYGLADVGDRVLLGRLEEPRTEQEAALAVVGDPHIATRSQGTYRVFHRTEQRLRAVIDDVNERAVDLVLFPGDLTKDGEPWNYDRVDALLEELERPFLATPGNHDLQKCDDDHRCPSATAFANRYDCESFPFHREVGGIDLFVLNSAAGPDGPYAETHRGRISSAQLEWLDDRLADASVPIVTCHHNPLPVVTDPLCRTNPWRAFTMRERSRTRSILERHGVSLVVTGHHHLPSLVKRNGLRQLIAPAIASFPQAYCLLEIDETGTNVWLVSHATETGRAEAYDLAADGPPFWRAVLGITENTLTDLPLLYEPTQLDDAALAD